jgi:hypothetical protein
LVDDDASVKAKAPRDDDRAMLKAYNCWLPCFDNMSGMPAGFSDTLCQMSTGIADTKRKHYENSEEVTYAVKRPVMLNGIPVVGTAPDYLDRVLLLDLPRLSARRTEAELEAEFSRVRAGVLGALLDAVSAALRTDAQGDWPRMADLCRWVTAAEQGMGWAPRFVAAFTDNQDNAASLEYEASPFVRAVVKLMAEAPVWEGTATELAETLDDLRYADEKARTSPAWPKGAIQTGNAVDTWASALREQGISVEKARQSKARTIRFTRAVTADDIVKEMWAAKVPY